MGGTSKVHGEHDQAWEGWICQNPSPLKNRLAISDVCFKIPVHVTTEIDTILSIPTQVFKLMKDIFNVGACRGSRHWKVCGSTVCGRGFMLMIGIGKGRLQTLAHAARNGEDHCPFDSRYIPKGPRVSDPRREKSISFCWAYMMMWWSISRTNSIRTNDLAVPHWSLTQRTWIGVQSNICLQGA